MKNIVIIGARCMALISELNRLKPVWEFAGYVVTDTSLLGGRDSRDEVVGDYEWLRANAN